MNLTIIENQKMRSVLNSNQNQVQKFIDGMTIDELRKTRNLIFDYRGKIIQDFAIQSSANLEKRKEYLIPQGNLFWEKKIFEEQAERKRKEASSFWNILKGIFGLKNKDAILAENYHSEASSRLQKIISNTKEVNQLQDEHIQMTIQREQKLNQMHEALSYIDLRIDRAQFNPILIMKLFFGSIFRRPLLLSMSLGLFLIVALAL